MAHLELLHHFTAVTSFALTVGTTAHHIWLITIPQVALSHDFLMHSLLAVSALHIAHLRSEQRNVYWERAAVHQDRALQLQQVAMAHPNRGNADALFAFSLLIINFAFASPKASNSPQVDAPLHVAVQCINMLRGTRYIVPSIREWVEEGPLAPLLLLQPSLMKSDPNFEDRDTDEYFNRLVIFCSTSRDMNNMHEVEDIENYAAAASSLRASFLKIESVVEGDLITPPIWQWAVRLPPTFVQRLGERCSVPLVLVAHVSRLTFLYIHVFGPLLL